MCDCIATINADLAQRGINTKKREKPSILFASHCPVCGEKYPAEEG